MEITFGLPRVLLRNPNLRPEEVSLARPVTAVTPVISFRTAQAP